MIGLRVRGPRSPIDWSVGVLSFALGVFGLILGSDGRSGAIEAAFPEWLGTAWYIVLGSGAALLILAAVKPWPEDLTLLTAKCMMNRLYLERAGLFMVGWVWQSYAFAAWALQGIPGSTAACVASIIGFWTAFRIREQFVDLPALREYIDAIETRAEVEGT